LMEKIKVLLKEEKSTDNDEDRAVWTLKSANAKLERKEDKIYARFKEECYPNPLFLFFSGSALPNLLLYKPPIIGYIFSNSIQTYAYSRHPSFFILFIHP
jgi:hypothetical protein